MLKAYLYLTAYPEIPAILARLAPRPCVILSNGSPRMLQAAVTCSGLTGRFTQVLSADLVQQYKPAPLVYALAQEALHLPPEHIVFVSANAFDVMGAKAYGFHVAWIKRTQAPLDPLGLTPDIVLTRLDDLPEAFPDA